MNPNHMFSVALSLSLGVCLEEILMEFFFCCWESLVAWQSTFTFNKFLQFIIVVGGSGTSAFKQDRERDKLHKQKQKREIMQVIYIIRQYAYVQEQKISLFSLFFFFNISMVQKFHHIWVMLNAFQNLLFTPTTVNKCVCVEGGRK